MNIKNTRHPCNQHVGDSNLCHVRHSDHGVSTSTKLTNSQEISVGRAHEDNDADEPDPNIDSKTMLASLGDDPSSEELACVAALRAREYIDECLSTEISTVDRTMWESIPQFTKLDLIIGQHLGKGTFSDVFEVIALIVDDEIPTVESLNLISANLDQLIKAKFQDDHDGEAASEGIGHDKGNDPESTPSSDARQDQGGTEEMKVEKCPPQNIDSQGQARASRRHTAEAIT